jgi:hypothetical protein
MTVMATVQTLRQVTVAHPSFIQMEDSMGPRRLFSIVAIAAATLGIVVDESRAGLLPVTLDKAIANSPFTFGPNGDKSVTFTTVSPGGTQPPSLPGITVADNTVGNLAALTFTGPIVVASGPGNTSDLSLVFTVTSSGPPIFGISLSATGAFANGGHGRITENVFEGSSVFGTKIGSITITDNASVAFSPLKDPITHQTQFSTITISKNILAETTGTTDPLAHADYTIVEQDFPQTAVPEPSTAVVAVFGATAFIAYGWSRHRREQRRQAAA